MTNITINVHLDQKCMECGKGGATDSGICLKCTTKVLMKKPMKSERGRLIAERIKQAIP